MRKTTAMLMVLAIVGLAGMALAQETAGVGGTTLPAAEPAAVTAAPAQPAASDAEVKAKLDKTQAALDAALRRIDELEVKVTAIGGKVDASSKDVSSLSSQVQGLETKAKEAPTAAAAPAFKFQPYGYIRADAVYDDTRTSGTDATAFVMNEKPGFGSDKYFSITVRQTRLGVNILGPDVGAAKQMGKVEIDFYANAASEAKAEVQLRQAYWQLTYPTWNILVGQTWEPMSFLAPTTLNYPALGLSGNAGHRRPLIRYERTDKVWGDKSLQSDLALARSIGQTQFSASSLDDEGSDSAWPVLEGRTALSIPTSLGRPVMVAVSGHLGQEEFDQTSLVAGPPASIRTTSGKGSEYMSYSGNLEWKAPVAKEFDFMGEFFTGRNLDAYMAGIGQGVNTGVTQGTTAYAAALNKGIDATGGWCQLFYKPARIPKWGFSVGAGIDDPSNDDLSGAVNKSRNATYFTNAVYNLTDKTQIGVELAYMATDYKSSGFSSISSADGDNFRVQTMLQYNFQ